MILSNVDAQSDFTPVSEASTSCEIVWKSDVKKLRLGRDFQRGGTTYVADSLPSRPLRIFRIRS